MQALVIVILLAVLPVIAYDGPGTADFAVMRMNYDARPLGMGEAFTAMAEGVYGLFWNPAGLVETRRREVLVGYRMLPLDVHGGIPAVANNVKANYGIGVAMKYLNYGEIPVITELNESTGQSFTPFSLVGIAGIARKWTKKLSAGMAVKGVYEKLYDDYGPKGVAVDLGVRYLPDFRRLGLAAVVQNLGAHAWTKDFSLPTMIKVGITDIFAWFPKTRLSLDIAKPVNNVFSYHMGAEYRQSKSVYLRSGFGVSQPDLERFFKRVFRGNRSDNAIERAPLWSLGGGYRAAKVMIDYGLQYWMHFGPTHAASLLFYL